MESFACHHCGYDLTGLGETGTCPECGNAYNINVRLGAPPRENMFIRYAGAILLGFVTLFILVCGGLMSLGAREPLGFLIAVLMVGGVFAFGTFVYWWTAYKTQQEQIADEKEAYEKVLQTQASRKRYSE